MTPARGQTRDDRAWRLSVVRDERFAVHESRDPLAGAVGDTGDDHAAVAVPAQHDVLEALELEMADDVLDVRVEVDGRREQMCALAEARQCRSRDVVTLGAQEPVDVAPLPAAAPPAVHDRELRRYAAEKPKFSRRVASTSNAFDRVH